MTDTATLSAVQRETTVPTGAPESDLVVADIEEVGIPPKESQWGLTVARIAAIIVVLIAWEIFGQFVDELFLASPSAIAVAAWNLAVSGELFKAMLSSSRSLFLGFFMASAIAVSLGLAIGRYRLVEAAVDWIVNALYAMPLVAIIPLVILWMGLGAQAKLFIVTLFAFFPILINTVTGVRNVPKELIDVGDSFAATEQEIFRKVILPAALPYVVTGLRLGIGRALIAMVVAEFFTAITGLGALIMKYEEEFDTASMFVPIITLAILGVLLTGAVGIFERRIAPWKATDN
jgi:NitT/TauT family transport system permease protein